MPRPFSVASHYHAHRNSPSPSLQFPQLDPRDETQPLSSSFYGSTSYTPRSSPSPTQTQQQHCDPYTQEKHAGAEPGVNPLHSASVAEYSHFVQACVIDVVDYDAQDAVFKRMCNDEFIGLMREQHPVPSSKAPPRRVRWINIGGIDWGVLSTLALKYNLHALSLEDILHERGHTHSKADYYPGHVFLRILCHSLQRGEPAPCDKDHHGCLGNNLNYPPSPLPRSELDLELGGECPRGRGVVTSSPEMLPPVAEGVPIDRLPVGFERRGGVVSASPEMIDPTEDARKKGKARMHLSSARHALRRRLTGMSGFMSPAGNKKVIQIRALTKGEGVNVKHEPLFIFLLRDGTVISIHPSTLDYTSPIAERLTQPDSVLRTSEDASLLVQSLLDLVVDHILEVMDEYQLKIHNLEHSILLNPGMDSVRSLHILSGDMILHKRTLDPIKTMIYGLRRYDLDRSAAIASEMALALAMDDEGKSGGGDSDRDRESEWDDVGAGLNLKKGKQHRRVPVEGFFSYKAKVYLADVYDHMDFALTSLDMFSGISENLINYAFNMASYEMNKVMNRLTLATIIFLPLTLLTGYFGMNFEPFWSVNENSDAFFWKIAVPIMAALIPIFMFEDIKKAFHYLQRRRNAQKIVGDLLL